MSRALCTVQQNEQSVQHTCSLEEGGRQPKQPKQHQAHDEVACMFSSAQDRRRLLQASLC